MKKKSKSRIAKKWIEIIGCVSYFNKSGVLEIYKNAMVHMMDRKSGERLTFRVVKITPRAVFVSHDGFQVSYVLKKHCKIV